MTKVAVFVGSLRKDSLNKKLADALERVAEPGTEFVHIDINMPLFNQDLEKSFPAEVQAAKDVVESADAVLILTPEYNRSVPGVLKNAIDWISRPYGNNSFAGKPVAIAGASIGPIGTAVAQNALQHVLTYLDMKVLGQPEVYFPVAQELFDDEGNLDEAREAELRQFMQKFHDWIK